VSRALEYLAVTLIALGATYLAMTPIAHAISHSIERSAATISNPQGQPA
jgi:hypothetical protein